jgi:hypothetical protein
VLGKLGVLGRLGELGRLGAPGTFGRLGVLGPDGRFFTPTWTFAYAGSVPWTTFRLRPLGALGRLGGTLGALSVGGRQIRVTFGLAEALPV